MARDGEGNRGRREKRGTPVGPKDRTDKGNSLTEDTPRDAVTNALRLHLNNFAYKTFKIKLVRCLVLVGNRPTGADTVNAV